MCNKLVVDYPDLHGSWHMYIIYSYVCLDESIAYVLYEYTVYYIHYMLYILYYIYTIYYMSSLALKHVVSCSHMFAWMLMCIFVEASCID